MKVFVCPSQGEMGKFQGVVRAFGSVWGGSVLDVGCRSGHLKHALPNETLRYCGMDLFPPVNIIGNLEGGLPFGNASSDTVVALDILEHTDDIYMAFSELCRVARKYVVVTLPNVYEIRSRLKILLGQRLSKYGLPPDPPRDRHRWFFSFAEAMAFIHTLGPQYGFEIKVEGCVVGPRRGIAGNRFMVSLCPNLLSPLYLALLERKRREE